MTYQERRTKIRNLNNKDFTARNAKKAKDAKRTKKII